MFLKAAEKFDYIQFEATLKSFGVAVAPQTKSRTDHSTQCGLVVWEDLVHLAPEVPLTSAVGATMWQSHHAKISPLSLACLCVCMSVCKQYNEVKNEVNSPLGD